jgi:predicted transcriptional regulator
MIKHSFRNNNQLITPVLISIKPVWANLIQSNLKTLEVRKILPTVNIDKRSKIVYIFYVSAPVYKIKFFVENPEIEIRKMNPDDLKKAKLSSIDLNRYGGLDREYYLMHISEFFETMIDPYELFEDFRPPQSYKFLSELEFLLIQKEAEKISHPQSIYKAIPQPKLWKNIKEWEESEESI